MISVIVPVYNTEKYLDQCVQSILAQTYTDFELLLIDDGSTDSSGALCDKYAEQDSRIRVFHKENGGVSSARNLGLDNVKGEWVTFCDSDDWVEYNYLSSLILKCDNDLVSSSYIYDRPNKKQYEQLDDDTLCINGYNLTELLMTGAYMTPYAKLYKSKVLEKNKIRFNTRLSSREDTLFVWQYLLCVDKVTTLSDATYHYCITDNGLSHKRISIDECKYSLECFYNVLVQFKEKFSTFDFRIRLYWLIDEIFLKAIKEEVCENKKFYDRRTKLQELLQSELVLALLKDKEFMPKGIKRKIWDFLALNKLYILLTIYLYYYDYS